MTKENHIIALALGSNLGDRLALLRQAAKVLEPFVTGVKKSFVYETPAAYVTDQPAFLNAALIGTTPLSPLALLSAVKKCEADLGRQVTFRYGPRVIDIDIIFYDDLTLAHPDLVLPHAKLAEREFVLRPLADIAAEWRHPAHGQTVQEMLKSLPHQTARRIEGTLE